MIAEHFEGDSLLTHEYEDRQMSRREVTMERWWITSARSYLNCLHLVDVQVRTTLWPRRTTYVLRTLPSIRAGHCDHPTYLRIKLETMRPPYP